MFTLHDDVSDGRQQVNLRGAGGPQGPAARLVPSSVDFGQAKVGTTVARTLTVMSVGTVPLAITSKVLSGADPGDFSATGDGCSRRTLDPGTSCVVELQFRPSHGGSRSAMLVLGDDASDSPQQVSLRGRRSSRFPTPPLSKLLGEPAPMLGLYLNVIVTLLGIMLLMAWIPGRTILVETITHPLRCVRLEKGPSGSFVEPF
jgi:hypothetical protein